MSDSPQVTVERLSAYDDDDATMMGSLFAQLTARYDGSPADEQTIRDLVDSPYHDLLVARLNDGRVVGTATVSITIGPVDKRRAWLEDFVVDSSTRGLGIGSKLWGALIEWCQQKGASRLAFTSRANKPEAHEFYLKRGAVIKDTNYFVKTIDQ